MRNSNSNLLVVCTVVPQVLHVHVHSLYVISITLSPLPPSFTIFPSNFNNKSNQESMQSTNTVCDVTGIFLLRHQIGILLLASTILILTLAYLVATLLTVHKFSNLHMR